MPEWMIGYFQHLQKADRGLGPLEGLQMWLFSLILSTHTEDIFHPIKLFSVELIKLSGLEYWNVGILFF